MTPATATKCLEANDEVKKGWRQVPPIYTNEMIQRMMQQLEPEDKARRHLSHPYKP